MANVLSPEVQHEVKVIYLHTHSIKKAARQTGVSRNTVRKLVRADIPPPPHSHAPKTVLPNDNPLGGIDFSLLEKFFEMGKDRAENLDFVTHVKALKDAIAMELEISDSTIDKFKLDTLMSEWIMYRRFFIRCFKASDANYDGPFARLHDKVAKANLRWAEAAQRSLDNFLKILRDLEITHHRRLDFGRGNTFIAQSAVQIGSK